MNHKQCIERIFTESNQTFTKLIKAIISNKIDELVNNANKVNTATSQLDNKERDVS